jgi:hypothetical protein
LSSVSIRGTYLGHGVTLPSESNMRMSLVRG